MGTSTKTLQYRYDSRGNRSALIDHEGGRFTYSYDTVNRIKEVLNPQGDRTTYSYVDHWQGSPEHQRDRVRTSLSICANRLSCCARFAPGCCQPGAAWKCHVPGTAWYFPHTRRPLQSWWE